MTPKQIIEAIKADARKSTPYFLLDVVHHLLNSILHSILWTVMQEKSVQASTQQTNSTMQLLFPLMKQQL